MSHYAWTQPIRRLLWLGRISFTTMSTEFLKYPFASQRIPTTDHLVYLYPGRISGHSRISWTCHIHRHPVPMSFTSHLTNIVHQSCRICDLIHTVNGLKYYLLPALHGKMDSDFDLHYLCDFPALYTNVEIYVLSMLLVLFEMT